MTKKIEKALEFFEVNHGGRPDLYQVLARALRSALKDRERLDYFLDWPNRMAEDHDYITRKQIDAAMKPKRNP